MSLKVELRGITKRFDSVLALEEVSLKVRPGTLHALVGENGAGKTTLMKALYGLIKPDKGEIFLEGKPVQFHSAKEAISRGIGMVSQHYAIIPELTCLQNLLLGAEPGEWLNLAAARERAEELAKKMDFSFDWDAPAQHIGPAGAQKLEILKLLWRDSDVLILDEPTATLSPSDSEALFVSIRKLLNEGRTCILVTHRLPEVLNHAEEVTVLRGGKLVGSQGTKGLTAPELAQMIVGRSVDAPVLNAPQLGNDLLKVGGLSSQNGKLKDVSFSLKEGELVGLAGVDGSGQRELFRALFGIEPQSPGSVVFRGKPLDGVSTLERIEQGMSVVAEDRLEESVISDWSLVQNTVLGRQNDASLKKGLGLDFSKAESLASEAIQMFNTKTSGPHARVDSLSGGNQQRFVVGRALLGSPWLILAFHPTRGLDIAAAENIFAELRRRCRAGATALVISFDLDELMTHCDRILTICSGRIREPQNAKDRDEIGRLMVEAE